MVCGEMEAAINFSHSSSPRDHKVTDFGSYIEEVEESWLSLIRIIVILGKDRISYSALIIMLLKLNWIV